MLAVYVLDRQGKALMPCSEKRARKLLAAGRARVHRRLPFAIRLVDRQWQHSALQPLQIKLDPGSKATGVALVRLDGDHAAVLNLMELLHRGRAISGALTARRQMRRARRSRNLRYRAPRFLNRGNKQRGWLAPSLQHRVNTTLGLVNRLRRLAPVVSIAQELVRFDMQAMENPDIEGVEYQQGTQAGYELREYLLEKWGRKCAYCDAQDTPLQIEHIHSKATGGSNRAANLTLACQPCNQKKAAQDVRVFLAHDPARLQRLLAQAKRPLKDAAAVSSTRWTLFSALKAAGLAVTVGSGGRTKYNRVRLQVPKTHALDAACVGAIDSISDWRRPTLSIKCTGRGSYQRTRLDAYGFPRGYLTRSKRVHGFQTGDMVSALVPKGKNTGSHVGRVAVRARGIFNIQTKAGVVTDVHHRHCTLIQRADGYGYFQSPSALLANQPREDNFPVSSRHLPRRLSERVEVGVPTGVF